MALSTFPCKPKIPHNCADPAKWHGSQADWTEIYTFLRALRWRVGDEYSVSFCELAVLFNVYRGGLLAFDKDVATYHDFYRKIRLAMQLLFKRDDAQAFPGSFHTSFAKSDGRTLPPSVEPPQGLKMNVCACLPASYQKEPEEPWRLGMLFTRGLFAHRPAAWHKTGNVSAWSPVALGDIYIYIYSNKGRMLATSTP